MNSFDILQAMTDIPSDLVFSARNKLGYEQETAIARKAAPKRIWLIAAVAALLLLLMGCAVSYFFSLQDMKVGAYNFYVPPAYDEDGNLEFRTSYEEGDFFYDEIGSVLKIKQYQNVKRELLESLETYYRIVFLGEGLDEEE